MSFEYEEYVYFVLNQWFYKFFIEFFVIFDNIPMKLYKIMLKMETIHALKPNLKVYMMIKLG